MLRGKDQAGACVCVWEVFTSFVCHQFCQCGFRSSGNEGSGVRGMRVGNIPTMV